MEMTNGKYLISVGKRDNILKGKTIIFFWFYQKKFFTVIQHFKNIPIKSVRIHLLIKNEG